MSWKCYKVVFKAEAPIHIGYKQIGILKTTRYYITGRAIWGAITANLTRALYDQPSSEDYRRIGGIYKENENKNFNVKKDIRTTYFYPAVCEDELDLNSCDDLSDFFVETKNKIYRVFIPKQEREIKYGNLDKEDFEKRFIGSFVSTALEPETKTAEEGSLHEIEYVRSRVNIKGKTVNVCWVGYIFVNEKSKHEDFSIGFAKDDIIIEKDDENFSFRDEIFKTVFIGGERNYGFGRVRITEIEEYNERKVVNLFNSEIYIDKENDLKLYRNCEIHALAHVNLENLKAEEIKGDIEPLVGREWSERGAGGKVSKAIISLTPGTCFRLKNDTQLKIGSYGIWEKA